VGLTSLISLGPIPRSLLRLGCGRPRRGRSGVGDPGYRVACFNAAELAPRIFTKGFAGIACGAASSILLPSLGYPCAILGGCFYLLTHRPSATAAMFGQGSPAIRPAIKRVPIALFPDPRRAECLSPPARVSDSMLRGQIPSSWACVEGKNSASGSASVPLFVASERSDQMLRLTADNPELPRYFPPSPGLLISGLDTCRKARTLKKPRLVVPHPP
jgi:hypothetical protein